MPPPRKGYDGPQAAKADGAKVSVRTHAKALKNEDAVVAVAAGRPASR